jgi:4-amino-4-deoxy-L-arabinose transferase-like glycosyltransferase
VTSRGERLALAAVLMLAAALRLPKLDRIPNGLIPDEALSAYDAFSIVETGRDAHGERLPLFPQSSARLHSLNMYLVVPWVALRGLDEWSARLPAALAGLATVALVFLGLRQPWGASAALCGAALLAVSPWHVLLSRTGYEWNLLPAMVALTSWLLARALVRGAAFWPAGLAAGISLYTYAPIRVLLPLLLLAAALTHAEEWRAHWRRALPALSILAVLAVPVAAMTLREEGRQRLSSIAEAGEAGPSAAGFLLRYLGSFSPGFLLAHGHAAELHRLRSTGLLHGFEAPLILAGVVACLARRQRRALFPLLLCASAPLAVAVHRDAPDPILASVMLPWLQVLGGIGAARLLEGAAPLPRAVRATSLVAAAVWAGFSVARTGIDIYREFPSYAARAWSHGVRDAVTLVEGHRRGHDDVVVATDEKLLFAPILFYTRYDPARRQAELLELPGRAERSRVGDYRIGSLAAARLPGRHLVWTTPVLAQQLPEARQVASIPLPDGEPHYALLSSAVPRAGASQP